MKATALSTQDRKSLRVHAEFWREAEPTSNERMPSKKVNTNTPKQAKYTKYTSPLCTPHVRPRSPFALQKETRVAFTFASPAGRGVGPSVVEPAFVSCLRHKRENARAWQVNQQLRCVCFQSSAASKEHALEHVCTCDPAHHMQDSSTKRAHAPQKRG